MAVRKIKEGIYEVGAIDWDRRLFDELIPLPDGTSYNSYLVVGKEKIALIDTVDPSKEKVLVKNIEKLNIERIDYIVSNHAEQDHSGTIPVILEMFPGSKVVTNPKAKEFLMDLLHIPEERFLLINEGETLNLEGRTLQFFMTPWVHWPETMVTYLIEDKILFTCDFFGSHLATSKLFADEKVLEPAKRYYAEIMMPFRVSIKNHLKKLENLDIEMIAPSHGPIYRNPSFIMNAYREWVSDDVKNEVVVAYVSMHGSTEALVRRFVDILVEKGVEVKLFNLANTDIGEYAISLVDCATLVIASPTVLTGLHPVVSFVASLTGALRPKLKYVGFIGSYSWGGRAFDQLKSLLTGLRAEFLDPFIIKGHPTE
ncbi:MAG: FprA family A-type flavoprotein, partial [Thermotogaceae bacterium]|nr:FprA family A-type flavoprotein [Thermotogaceae bacterium]